MTRRAIPVPFFRAAGRVVAIAIVVASSTSCSSGKREAASLVSAVERYRKATMDAKGAPADLLEKIECSDVEVCAAKAACVASSRPTARGMALKRDVEKSLDDLHAGRITREQASALGLSQKLDDASRAIDEGRANLSACDARITALRLKYAL